MDLRLMLVNKTITFCDNSIECLATGPIAAFYADLLFKSVRFPERLHNHRPEKPELSGLISQKCQYWTFCLDSGFVETAKFVSHVWVVTFDCTSWEPLSSVIKCLCETRDVYFGKVVKDWKSHTSSFCCRFYNNKNVLFLIKRCVKVVPQILSLASEQSERVRYPCQHEK